jgi:hypothetical protein
MNVINKERANEATRLRVQRAAKEAKHRAEVERRRIGYHGLPRPKTKAGKATSRSTGRTNSTPKRTKTRQRSFHLNNVNSGTGDTNATLRNGNQPKQEKRSTNNRHASLPNANAKKKPDNSRRRSRRQDNPSGKNRFASEIAKVRDHNLKYLKKIEQYLDALKKELQETPFYDLQGRKNLEAEIKKYKKIAEDTKNLIQKQNDAIRRLNKFKDKTKSARQEAERRRKKQAEQAQKQFEQRMIEDQAKKVRNKR